jgi:ParB/RepB/Spo0J family partition protein
MDVLDIPLDKLVPSRNLRTESGDIEELVESIREHGLLQPIRVRPTGKGLYQIIAGHRRFLSHRVLGLRAISAVVVDETDEAAAVQSIVENLQRENLTPLELAKGIRELATGFDLTSEQIGQAISKSPSQVRNWIRLSRLPDDVLEKIESGEGRQQIVTGLTPRHIQPFVSDLPSDEEVTHNPDAAALYENRIISVRQLQQEIGDRGIHINAHMADEVARRVKKEQATVAEAIDTVLANPELYRPTHFPYKSVEEFELDTWSAYRKIQDEMRAHASRLRPDIAVGFRPAQKHDLLERLLVFFASLEPYRQSLQPQEEGISTEPPQLMEGESDLS